MTQQFSNRIKKLQGRFTNSDFEKLLKQLDSRGLLVVAIINNNCEECSKLINFVQQLETGFIKKLPQLVMLYGHNTTPLDQDKKDSGGGESGNAEEGKEDGEKTERQGRDKKKKTNLGVSRDFSWEEGIEGGHGYVIFQSTKDILTYHGIFDHDEFVNNIIDNLRRFKSTAKSLAGLPAKRKFMDDKRSGIIIETNSGTSHSKILELENAINSLGEKLKTPVYFCKGISQEISLVSKGVTQFKLKGLNFDRFIKKIPR